MSLNFNSLTFPSLKDMTQANNTKFCVAASATLSEFFRQDFRRQHHDKFHYFCPVKKPEDASFLGNFFVSDTIFSWTYGYHFCPTFLFEVRAAFCGCVMFGFLTNANAQSVRR